jgi:hypothetical protein
VNFSTPYHPKIDGKTKRMEQILEDMLHMYVMYQHKRWEEFFPLVELCTTKDIKVPLRWHHLSFSGDRVEFH